MKRVASIMLSIICLLSLFSTNVFAKSKEPSVSDVTLGQIQDWFVDYVKDNGLQLMVGTREYYDYIAEQLLEHSDKNLLEVSNYDLIHAYMVEYKVTYDDYLYLEEILSGNSDSIIDFDSLLRSNSCIGYEKNGKTVSFNISSKFLSMTIGDIIAQNEREAIAANSEAKACSASLSGYSGSQAASYAIQYASGHNSAFPHYSADCTNFVSQCLYAGGIAMDGSQSSAGTYETTSDWYCIYTNSFLGIRKYAVTTSWMRVADFKTFMSSLVSTYTKTTLSSLVSSCAVGDIVQLADKTTGTPYHSIIISGKDQSTAYFCGHTNSRNNANVYNYLDEGSDEFILFDFT